MAGCRHYRLRFCQPGTGIFVDPAGEAPMSRLYRRMTPQDESFDDVLYACKKRIMQVNLASEMNVLAREFHHLAMRESPHPRLYVQPHAGGDGRGRRRVSGVPDLCLAARGERRRPPLYRLGDRACAQRWRGADVSIFDFLRGVLTGEAADPQADPSPGSVIDTAMHFQQVTGPVMAKAAEDTAFYRYVRLLALNEVGGDPRRFGMSVTAFHHLAQQRARQWPQCDGDDRDARYQARRGCARPPRAVVGDAGRMGPPGVPMAAAQSLAPCPRSTGEIVPDRNVEYLFYQALFGAWPPGLAPDDIAGIESLAERLEAYMIKAVREQQSSKPVGATPTPNTRRHCSDMCAACSTRRGSTHSSPISTLSSPRPRVTAAITSLAQLTLKLTVPGVPDIYQGGELWDFSLVDPDNRRPVDWEKRRSLLEATDRARPEELAGDWQDGREKLFATRRLLALRRAHAELFSAGDYQPLEVSGERSQHLCAFVRRHAGLVAGGRGSALGSSASPRRRDAGLGRHRTQIAAQWRVAGHFYQRRLDQRDLASAAELFADFPVAVLMGEHAAE